MEFRCCVCGEFSEGDCIGAHLECDDDGNTTKAVCFSAKCIGEAYGDVSEERNRLAERVKKLEKWIDKLESNSSAYELIEAADRPITAKDKRIAEFETALNRYGEHDTGCLVPAALSLNMNANCSCGFSKAKKAIREAPKAGGE